MPSALGFKGFKGFRGWWWRLTPQIIKKGRGFAAGCVEGLCIASLRGPPIGGQDSDGASYRRSALYTLCLFEAFPSRGNEKIGGTGYCVTYDTDSQSRNVLASPLGEEGHEVAKGWTVVILIMILDVDVTAAGGL